MSAPKSAATGAAPFVECSPRQRCTVCNSPDWCTFTTDGRVRQCMRVLSAPGAVRKVDQRGQEFALYFSGSGPAPTGYPVKPAAPIASTADRDRTYRALLDALPLWPEHRDALLSRGLTDEAIDAAGYRSLPSPTGERAALVRRVREALSAGGGDLPADIPGLHRGKLSGSAGLVVPVRDADGQLIALKVRADRGEAKYTWVSSASDGGASPGSPAHVPAGARAMLDAATAEGRPRAVRITEGPLKADVATHLSGVATLGIPGATAVRCIVPVLKDLGAEVIRLAWDADARKLPADPRRTNHVAGGLEFAAHLLSEELTGARVELETWPADEQFAPKGVDDALHAGAVMQVHAAQDMWRELVAILHAAGRTPEARTLARAGMEAEDEIASGAEASAPNGGSDDPPSGAVDPAAPAPQPPGRRRTFDRGDAVELAHAVLEDLQSDSPHPIVHDRGAFFRYEPTTGAFAELARGDLYTAVAGYAGCWSGTAKPKPLLLGDNSINGAINAAAHFAARPGFFDGATRGVCFADCFVTARSGEVLCLPLSPDHRALHFIPVPYEMDASRTRWVAMLREVFRREREDGSLDHEDTEGCICLLQEFIGASIVGLATSLASCLILVGPGNDGKSKVLSVLRALFPASALCALPPQDWGQRFRTAELAGKRLNVVSELPERDILDAERFKAVVAGDPITAERKNRDPFMIHPEAGHLFATNGLPPTKDQSKGFWRRFKVIPCNRQFSADEEVKDYDRLVIAEELAGVAAWAMEGAARVQAQERYTTPPSSEEAHAEWRHDTDQVRQWREECCFDDPQGTHNEGIDVLYAAYRAWCAESGHPPLARNTLGNRLKALGCYHRSKLARTYTVALKPRWRGASLPGHDRRMQ